MADGEVLIVGGGDAATRGGRVVARVEPDIVVIQADAQQLSELARSARFAVSRDPEAGVQTFGDERVLDELDSGSQLFVRAWRERALDKPNRPGQGQSWGATGFEPPDLPSHS
jgi:siroheme synthase (precorrin-2 oxidase/ferrochelatase)